MMRRHGVYQRLYSRFYRTILLAQSLTPNAVRRGPWRRALSSGHLDIDRTRLFIQLLPKVGLPIAGADFVTPDRYWLEPSDGGDRVDQR
jgi:hypothetical protein